MEIHVGDADWRNGDFTESKKQGGVMIFFHDVAVQNNAKTREAGRPIFETKTFLQKIVPGDRLLDVDRPMRPGDPEEFPEAWARYQAKQENRIDGTPIEAWPIMTVTMAAEMKALRIYTVEQFASLPDSAGRNIMGFSDLRDKARRFLLAAKDSALLEKTAAANAEKDQTIAELTKQVRDLTEKVAALTGGQPARKKPGPKAKAAVAAGA